MPRLATQCSVSHILCVRPNRQRPWIVNKLSQLLVEVCWEAVQSCQSLLPFAASFALQLLLNTMGQQLAAHQPYSHALPLHPVQQVCILVVYLIQVHELSYEHNMH